MGKVTPKDCIYPEDKLQIYKFKLYLDSPLTNELYEYFTTPIYPEV